MEDLDQGVTYDEVMVYVLASLSVGVIIAYILHRVFRYIYKEFIAEKQDDANGTADFSQDAPNTCDID